MSMIIKEDVKILIEPNQKYHIAIANLQLIAESLKSIDKQRSLLTCHE